jgi:hypothetical protein
MTERYDQDTILGYVEGELSDDQSARFEALLAEDHELRQLVSQLRLDREALRSLGGVCAPVGLVDQVIQTHERAALLGDPAAPDPPPLVIPMSKRKLRRVLAYSGIAAVLLLSFGLVFQTLIPPGLLDQGPSLAQLETDSDTAGAVSIDTGSGLAMVDEDAVYDESGVNEPGPMKLGAKVALTETVTPPLKYEADAAGDSAVSGLVGAGDQLARADTSRRSVAALKAPEVPEAPAESSLALEDQSAQPGADSADGAGVRSGRVVRAEPVEEAETVTAGPLAAAPADAFAGYTDRPVPARTRLRTRLLVESASPTQARRDIRDWAIANSARVVEVPARGGLGGAVGDAEMTAGRARGVTESRGARGIRGNRGFQGGAGVAAVPLESVDAPRQLVVVVEDSQVPGLLEYLNRGRGQHASLVTAEVKPDAVDNLGASKSRLAKRSAKETGDHNGSDSGSDADREKDQPPSALANRLVDTRSGWRRDGMAMGMASTQDAREKHGSEQEAKTQPAKPSEPPPFSDAFDWSRLLEPKSPAPAPLLTPQPTLQPDASRRVRLKVVIRQVADSNTGTAPGGTATSDQPTADDHGSPPADESNDP